MATQVAPAPAGDGAGPDQLQSLQKCRLWAKLKAGEIHQITKDNIQELYGVLDSDESGELTTEDLQILKSVPEINLTAEDIEAIAADCDVDGSGKVSCEELYKAFTMGSLSFKKLQESFRPAKILKPTECTRDGLIEYMIEEYETLSALWSLPQTIILFIVFIICVQQHLRVDIAFRMQDSLEGGVTGEGAPFLRKFVHDIPSMWEWMETSFTSVTFKQDLFNFPYPGRLESYSQIIGGVELLKIDKMASDCPQSMESAKFYNQIFAKCDMGESVQSSEFLLYHEKSDDLLKQMEDMKNSLWLSLNTSEVNHRILFYNAYLNAYTDYTLKMSFANPRPSVDDSKDGTMYFYFTQETFLAEPYYNMWIVACDLIYVVIVFRMMAGELSEIIPASLNGLDGFMNYWDIWNLVDWSSMSLSIGVMVIWCIHVYKVSYPFYDAIAQLPTEQLDLAIFVNQSYFSKDELDKVIDRKQVQGHIVKIHEMAGDIGSNHDMLRKLIFWNALLMMMKFLKAFRANPRLNVVIMTLTASAIDFFHFMIVFFLIMMVYALMGYSYFGTFLREFHELTYSMVICWRILMGEDIVDDMEEFGMFWAFIWVFSYQFFVGLILLNMTVAIIMDAYTAVNSGGDKLTIWTQVAEAVRTKKETRGFVDLWYLICEFKDDDEPAHPGTKVTARSLRRAFERKRMTKANAEYLVSKTQDYIASKEEAIELSLTDALKVIGQVRTHTLKTSHNVEAVMEMMKAAAKAPQEARFDAIVAGIDPDAPGAMMGQPMMGQPGMAKPHFVGGGSFGGLPPTTTAVAGVALPGNGTLAVKDANTFSTNGFQALTNGNGDTSSTMSSAGFKQAPQPITNGPVPTNHFPPHPGAPGTTESAIVPSTGTITAPQPGRMGTANSQGSSQGTDPAMLAMLQQMGPMMMQMMNQNNNMMMQMQSLFGHVETLSKTVKDQEKAREKKHELIEQRLFALERRNERVEKACDQLRNTLQGVDFDELMRMPTMVSESVASRVLSGSSGLGPDVSSSGGGGMSNSNHSPATRKAQDKRLEDLAAEMKQVLALSEEAAESRKMLWRIELTLKQMKATQSTSQPQPPLPGNQRNNIPLV